MIELIRRSLALKPDLKFVVLVQKIHLLKQTAARFSVITDKISIYSGSIDKCLDGNIVIATIQSIYKEKFPINCIIIDEAHNGAAEEGRYKHFIEANKHERLKLVGFTATPFRSASGKIYGKEKMFNDVDYKIHMSTLIEEGFLVRPISKRVEHQFSTNNLRITAGDFNNKDLDVLTSDLQKTLEQIHDAIPRLEGRKKIVWACANIRHATDVLSMLKHVGEKAAIIHSKQSATENESQQYLFENSDYRHLVFVSIVSEGYDYKPIDAIVLMRPMRSPVMYVQTIGRGLRPFEGKKDCLVLDYGKVVETLGAVDDPLIPQGNKRNQPEKRPMKFCTNCLSYVAISVRECPDCGSPFKMPESKPRLERKASELSLLKENKQMFLIVKDIVLRKHKSNNGNICLRIDYISTDLLQSRISEFFVWGKDWAYRKMQARLVQLDCVIAGSIDEQVLERPKKIPSQIVYKLEEGRYHKVIQMIW